MINWSQAHREVDFWGTLLTEKCKQHTPSKLGYVAKSENAEKKIKQGHIQKRCPKCGYWFFKCEF